MKRKFLPAFNALKKLGVPVYEHADDNGNFSIDAEAAEAGEWVNYYAPAGDWIFGVHPKLDALLRERGLFAEWVNPGRIAVYIL